MKPHFFIRNATHAGSRAAHGLARAARGAWLLAGLVLLCGGCAQHMLGRSQSPDLDQALAENREQDVKLIGDYATAWGMNYLKVEGVAMVTGLNGTGSNPPDSLLRDRLIAEMETHNVKSPPTVLRDPDTALVLVRGFLPPGAQKGDTFDVEISIPARSETSSLEGGWLMPVRMRQMEVLGGTIHTGEVTAQAAGGLLIDAVFDGDDDPTRKIRGRVLGGGLVQKPRKLGLVVRGENHPSTLTAMMAGAINARFFSYNRGGVKHGVATAKDGKLIELEVPHEYRNYLSRYIGVIRNMAISESPGEQLDRVRSLERQLLDPETTVVAALRLEAIGAPAVATLENGLQSPDAKVRFCSAEALAYLNDPKAIPALGQAAESEPAFRWHAITALAAMDEFDAADALAELFHSASAETRYGAFRALRSRSAHDPLVKGELLGQKFHYHVISTVSQPMVHVSRTRRPEVVLFGHDQTIEPPGVLLVGDKIMIKGVDQGHVKVLRMFAGTEKNEERLCSTRTDEIIRAIVDLGGGYTEVLAALQEARTKNHMTARLAIDALPRSGRHYRDEDGDDESPEGEDGSAAEPTAPLPELFRTGNQQGGAVGIGDDVESELEQTAAPRSIFGRMMGWLSG